MRQDSKASPYQQQKGDATPEESSADYPSKGAIPPNAENQDDEANRRAVERAREAIRRLAVALEHSVGEMMGSVSTYGDALDGHKSTIEKGLPSNRGNDFGTVLLNELTAMQASNDGYRNQLIEANTQIAKQKVELDSLQELAFIDFLTKIPNRRSLEQKVDEEAYRAKRYNQPLSLAFVDIDRFKDINDKHSHQIGDRILRGVAMQMQTAIRRSDFLARYGGEEFAVLLPATTVNVAGHVAEKLRSNIERSIFRTENVEIQITVSIGVGEFQPEAEDIEAFFTRTDAAMYKAKANGRNCTVKAQPASK